MLDVGRLPWEVGPATAPGSMSLEKLRILVRRRRVLVQIGQRPRLLVRRRQVPGTRRGQVWCRLNKPAWPSIGAVATKLDVPFALSGWLAVVLGWRPLLQYPMAPQIGSCHTQPTPTP